LILRNPLGPALKDESTEPKGADARAGWTFKARPARVNHTKGITPMSGRPAWDAFAWGVVLLLCWVVDAVHAPKGSIGGGRNTSIALENKGFHRDHDADK
jgi:hypothetical protein